VEVNSTAESVQDIVKILGMLVFLYMYFEILYLKKYVFSAMSGILVFGRRSNSAENACVVNTQRCPNGDSIGASCSYSSLH